MILCRREFILGGIAAGLGGGCLQLPKRGGYSVALLGDTHFDVAPESVYHSLYDESNPHAAIHHKEFRRNGEMWRARCPSLVRASAELARRSETRFVLQLGDLIQGDCDDAKTHRRMLDDCVRSIREPYPDGLPFLTVLGNHDVRGKGARSAYLAFAEDFMTAELAKLSPESASVKYPAFARRIGPDLWIFCDFEMPDLDPISDLIEADPTARHVFLVTHGPFTTYALGNYYRWRLGGRKASEASRMRLFRTLLRRQAIVLSGHTHTTCFYRHENEFGSFTECTVNSVWATPEKATAESKGEGSSAYAPVPGRFAAEKQTDYEREIAFFRPSLKDCYFGLGAGHYRLDVSDHAVALKFYPGDALVPARTFELW